MYLKIIASITLLTYMTLPAYAQSCNKSSRVFFCQTKDNNQISLCKKGNQYHYEYGYIGSKPKHKLKIPKNKMSFEYYVVEGTRSAYSMEFMHNTIQHSLTTNYPRHKSDKTPAYAIMIQSQNQGNKILMTATCRMDTLTDNIKKYQ